MDHACEVFFENCTLPLAIVDADDQLLRVNAALCHTLGRTAEQLVGEPLDGVLRPGDGADRPGADVPRRYTSVDGADGYATVGRTVLEDGRDRVSTMVHVVDVTNELLAQHDVRRIEEQRIALGELTRATVEEISESELLDRVNRLLVDHLDADRASVTQCLPDGIGLFHRASCGVAIDGDGSASRPLPSGTQAAFTIAGGTGVVSRDLMTEGRFGPDQRLISAGLRTSCSAPVDVDGCPWGVLAAHRFQPGSFTDDDRLFLEATSNVLSQALATERHRIIRAAAMDQKRQANAGILAIGAAHDLGNTLAVVRMQAQLLLTDPKAPRAIRPALETLDRHARMAAELVGQVVDAVRDERPRLEGKDLDVFLGCLTSVLHRLVPPSVAVEHFASGVGVVAIDVARVHQIVLNLVFNAADAMPDGGAVTVRADGTGGSPAGIAITVTDTGSGMDADVEARAFDPFFSTKSSSRGAGLGLPQVAHLVKELHGTVALETTPGEGTNVRVWLPTE